MRVLAIGESLIELQAVGRRQLAWTFAGDVLNCAVAVARAEPSARVQHLTGIGDDEASAEFISFCGTLGVDARLSPVIANKTLGLYWIASADGDRRFSYWRSDSAARALFESDQVELPERTYDLIIFSGITLAIAGTFAPDLVHALAKARLAGAKIAFDTNFRQALWPDVGVARERIEQAVAISDFVHTSSDDLESLFSGHDDVVGRWSRVVGVEEMLTTHGSGPVSVVHRGSQMAFDPAPVPVVDSAGAGDAFYGTYLGCRLGGQSPEIAIERALQVGATVVQWPGALGYLAADSP